MRKNNTILINVYRDTDAQNLLVQEDLSSLTQYSIESVYEIPQCLNVATLPVLCRLFAAMASEKYEIVLLRLNGDIHELSLVPETSARSVAAYFRLSKPE
jgi:hypothetical protein